MFALIIISKNQFKYLGAQLDKVKDMSIKPDKVYYMMDRDSADDVKLAHQIISNSGLDNVKLLVNNDIPDTMGRPMMYDGEEHFLAGYCRNKCIDIAIEDGCDKFVFIDGDCIPEDGIVAGYTKYLSTNKPMALCGRRDDFQHMFRDQREFNHYDNMFADEIVVINNYNQVLDSAVLWTCNFGMNIECVNRIRLINKSLYGNDEVFSSFFAGTWGGEDGFLGVECFLDDEITLAGIGVKRSGITHIHHDRPERKYSHHTFMKHLSNMVKVHEYMIENFGIGVD